MQHDYEGQKEQVGRFAERDLCNHFNDSSCHHTELKHIYAVNFPTDVEIRSGDFYLLDERIVLLHKTD